MKRGNAGDAEGLAILYEPNTFLAFSAGEITTGRENIRRLYEKLLASKPKFEGEARAALQEVSLQEVARRQPDDSRLGIID